MARTYSKVYLHIIFAVKNRQPLISAEWEDDLYKYITGVVQNHGNKLLQINGTHDHIHILIDLYTKMSISELISRIKKGSNQLINTKLMPGLCFKWQGGYAVFAVSPRDRSRVLEYIRNQKEHHRIKSFIEEYREFLEENDMLLDVRYLP